MKVKDTVIGAMKYLGLNKAAEQLTAGNETDYSKETQEAVKTLLFCYNAVEDEIARGYFPLVKKEKMNSRTGKFVFAEFSQTPIKILNVTYGGKEIKFKLFATYMQADCTEAEIEYSYCPNKKAIEDDGEFPALGSALVALGMAAEYSVIDGEIEYAKYFESKYRDEIERAIKKMPSAAFKTGYIPPRRWI